MREKTREIVKNTTYWRSRQSANINSDFTPAAPKSATKESLSPIFVASEQGLDASGQANIQTAATKVTNIGDRLSLVVSVLPLSAVNWKLSGKYWLKS